MTVRRALITGVTGQDGSYLAELLLDKGYEVHGTVRRSSTESSDRIDHLRGRINLMQADLLDQASLMTALQESQPHEVYNLGAQSFVPDVVVAARADRRVHGHRRDAPARGDPRRRPVDPLLPGVVVGDVRQGARGAAERGDGLLPAVAVRRRQGVRPLHHGQLPRVVRALRRLGHPLQPRVAAPRAGVRDAEDHRRRRAHQARPRDRAAPRQPRRRARLGLRRRLRRGDVADAPAGDAERLRDRDGRDALGARVRRRGVRARGARPRAPRRRSTRRSCVRPRSTS